MTTDQVATHLDALDERYVALHTAKEDAFWSAKMGLGPDPGKSQAELDARDLALQQFLQDPKQLLKLRDLLPSAATVELRQRVEGWERTFAAHTIDSQAGAALAEELAADDGRLQIARGAMQLGFQDPAPGFVPASSVKLSNMIQNDPSEARRRAAFDGLRSIEGYVLEHGFLELVAKRNRLGRLLGGEDYYDWRTKRIEGMSKGELFALLDELEERTRLTARAFVDGARTSHGPRAGKPWN